MMTGSAIRKPRIQPGFGSAQDDSMIEGRTMLIGTGTAPAVAAFLATVSVILRVTNSRPRRGDSWLNRMPLVAKRPYDSR